MSSRNPFDLLGEFDHDDPELAVAASVQQTPPRAAPAAKFPSKPVPPAQAVRDARGAQGGIRGRAPRGRGSSTYANENAGGYAGDQGWEDGDGGRPTERARGAYSGPRPFRGGGRRGAHANIDAGGERRVFERRSGTGRGMEMKREGSGRGNWGTTADEIVAQGAMEVPVGDIGGFQKESELATKAVDEGSKEDNADEMMAEKEEDKEMTLEEYQKVMEEKRKALIAMKAAERKVELDKEFESMTLLSVKKGNDDIFIKLGSEKDSRKSRDDTDRDERTKKPVSINEFLKPADGERHYRTGGRGRGGGRGDRGNAPFGYETSAITHGHAAIKIEDTKQFPLLGGK